VRQKIRDEIRCNTSPRHVPAESFRCRRSLHHQRRRWRSPSRVIHGEEVRNRDALANPEALEYFRGLEELKE
jgi:acetoacetyl-CoA synthetase